MGGAKGLDMGASQVEPDLVPTAAALLDKAERRGVRIYLPLDSVIGRKLSADSPTEIVPVLDIPDGWMALDIGPDSVKFFAEGHPGGKNHCLERPPGSLRAETVSAGDRRHCPGGRCQPGADHCRRR